MRKVFLMMLLSGVAFAQKPPESPLVLLPEPPKVEPPKQAEPPKLTGVDKVIAAALRQHPDIKLAEAKRLMAEAELEQARMGVIQKITHAFTRVEQAKARHILIRSQHDRLLQTFKTGATPREQLEKSESDLLAAGAELAAAEADLLAVKGGAPKPSPITPDPFAIPPQVPYVVGPSLPPRTSPYTPDRIPRGMVEKTPRPLPKSAEALRLWLNKPVKLDLGGDVPVADVIKQLKSQTGQEDLTIRLPAQDRLPHLSHLTGTHTVQVWLQIIMDDIARFTIEPEKVVAGGNPLGAGRITYVNREKFQIYVRDYGLLVTATTAAPHDALTLDEFLKMVPETAPAAKPK